MKTRIFFMVTVLFLGIGLFMSCESKNEEKNDAVVYTCPMHPEIQEAKMGTCSKCNMDLVKKED